MANIWTRFERTGMLHLNLLDDVTIAYDPAGQGSPFLARVGHHLFYARTLYEAQHWAVTMVTDCARFLPEIAS